MIVAAIFMGDPRFIAGVSYDVGTCEAGGVRFLLSISYQRPSSLYQEFVNNLIV